MSDIANIPPGTGGGNLTAKYIIQTADATLPNAQILGSLATGILKNTTTTGALSVAAAGTDYIAPGGTAGGQTLSFGSATGVNGVIQSNTSQDGVIAFGTMTTPSKWFDTTNSAGVDFWSLKSGKNAGGIREVMAFQNRGASFGDDVAIGFAPASGGSYGGGSVASPCRIECIFSTPNIYQFRFKPGNTSGTATEVLRLDGSTLTSTFFGDVTMTEAKNLVIGTTTGTKIGTGTTQKIGFWNATPVVQYSTTGTSTGFTAGAGTTVTHLSTFTGNLGSTAYTIADVVKALKTCGFMAQ